ncbi:hypothetical protein EZJ43_00810 [Pedobacter changchengzhani]|uniref:LPS export ABC transporter periplasmic protein LptC n=1 Tax=Pedobacter changchengzhani TaxID=2529274 RepID=A0A4R5MP94_9SPHI|nr:LPS export ABC transporter periplasmic protein LptC [Pedobacter changchengzhani]TDG37667.1 hypothetical protein EZJ43_00810 [Pedobacter changchengzhani]
MKIKTFFSFSAFLAVVLLVACSGDELKNVNSISAKKITFSKDRTEGVEIIYSDSARVKGKGTAPILDKITPSDGSIYEEMPKGVKIDFYDVKGALSGTLVSDYAIRRESEQKTTFTKNVVVNNVKGDKFSSEELIWDEGKKLFYSNQRVYVTTPDGNNVDGMNFEAPQDFSSYRLTQGSGAVNMKEGLSPQ